MLQFFYLRQEAHAVLFAVKPQHTVEVLDEMKRIDLSGKTIISIMAGVPLSVLKKGIKGPQWAMTSEGMKGFSSNFLSDIQILI